MQMIIIGDSGVGKTSFMDRFVEGNHQVKNPVYTRHEP